MQLRTAWLLILALLACGCHSGDAGPAEYAPSETFNTSKSLVELNPDYKYSTTTAKPIFSPGQQERLQALLPVSVRYVRPNVPVDADAFHVLAQVLDYKSPRLDVPTIRGIQAKSRESAKALIDSYLIYGPQFETLSKAANMQQLQFPITSWDDSDWVLLANLKGWFKAWALLIRAKVIVGDSETAGKMISDANRLCRLLILGTEDEISFLVGEAIQALLKSANDAFLTGTQLTPDLIESVMKTLPTPQDIKKGACLSVKAELNYRNLQMIDAMASDHPAKKRKAGKAPATSIFGLDRSKALVLDQTIGLYGTLAELSLADLNRKYSERDRKLRVKLLAVAAPASPDDLMGEGFTGKHKEEMLKATNPVGKAYAAAQADLFENLEKSVAKAETFGALERLVFALAAYDKRNGQLPDTLGMLQMPDLTIDPSTGKEFIYSKRGRAVLPELALELGFLKENNQSRYQFTIP